MTPDGRLNLGGAFPVVFRQCQGSCITFVERQLTWTISGWDTQFTGANMMEGRWVQNITAIGEPGNAYMEWELRQMRRTSADGGTMRTLDR